MKMRKLNKVVEKKIAVKIKQELVRKDGEEKIKTTYENGDVEYRTL